MTKCPRRFCCQQPSFSSVQTGCSLPLLTRVSVVAEEEAEEEAAPAQPGAAVAVAQPPAAEPSYDNRPQRWQRRCLGRRWKPVDEHESFLDHSSGVAAYKSDSAVSM